MNTFAHTEFEADMSPMDPRQSFKSRFSLASLVPSRHPPLQLHNDQEQRPPLPAVSALPLQSYRPILPTHHIPSHTTTESTRYNHTSRIQSQYASPDTVCPETPVFRPALGRSKLSEGKIVFGSPLLTGSEASRKAGRSGRSVKRPPPLDLSRIRAAYPTARAVDQAIPPVAPALPVAGTSKASPPILPPLAQPIREAASVKGMTVSKIPGGLRDSISSGADHERKAERARRRQEKKEWKFAEKKAKKEYDPFDIGFAEDGQLYPSYQGGRVDIKPGQVIPQRLLNSGTGPARQSTSHNGGSQRRTITGEDPEAGAGADMCGSVLHNVLLTPTYFLPSPSSASNYSRSRNASNPHSPEPRIPERGETVLEKAKRASRFLAVTAAAVPRGILKRVPVPIAGTLRGGKVGEGEGSMKGCRGHQVGSRSDIELAPSGAETMSNGDRSPGRLGRREEAIGETGAKLFGNPKEGGSKPSQSDPPMPALKPVARYAHARVEKEEAREFKVLHHHQWDQSRYAAPEKESQRHSGRDEEGIAGWWCYGGRRKNVEKMPAWRRLFLKYRILIAILVLVAGAVSLAAVLLSRKSSSSSAAPASTNGTSTASPSSTSGSIITSLSVSEGLTVTITSSAPAPTSTSRTLQMCLDNFLSSTNGSYACSDCLPLLLGTTNDFTVPLVNGNSTGVGAAVQYCTLLDVVAAGDRTRSEQLGWTGRGSCTWSGVNCDSRGRVTSLSLTYPNVPARLPSTLGQIPTLTTLRIKGNHTIPSGPFPTSIIGPSLTTLDITDTALQGPISNFDFTKSPSLGTVYLANNAILGSGMPDFKANSRLVTLAMTGQLMSEVREGNLPNSLTYLDLSFNAYTGHVPSFSSFTSLRTLYLESNRFTSPPQSLPSGLTDLKLNNNPGLQGGMPASLCGSAGLTSCDLRNTGLSGSGGGTAGANGSRSCGRCLF